MVWIRPSVKVTTSVKAFDRSPEGWTVFELANSTSAEFSVELDGKTYDCEAAMKVSCVS